MFNFANKRASFTLGHLALIATISMMFPITGCQKQGASTAQAGPMTFPSPEDAGRTLANAAKAQDEDQLKQIFGPGSVQILSTGNANQDKNLIDQFSRDYQVMNRWRRLADGTEILLVGADNRAFPIPLMKNASGQWYFDVAAGKEEILSRRIGRDEIAAMRVCAAVFDAQQEYLSQKHGGVKQYAQKFISDSGQQNGLYWASSQGSPRSPLGPLVAFATAEGYNVQPGDHQPFNGYYFALLDKQGSDANGGAKSYISNGKMTGGFGIIAYPAQYGASGIMTFIANQDGVLFQKDLGKGTDQVASAITEFNPDKTWSAVE